MFFWKYSENWYECFVWIIGVVVCFVSSDANYLHSYAVIGFFFFCHLSLTCFFLIDSIFKKWPVIMVDYVNSVSVLILSLPRCNHWLKVIICVHSNSHQDMMLAVNTSANHRYVQAWHLYKMWLISRLSHQGNEGALFLKATTAAWCDDRNNKRLFFTGRGVCCNQKGPTPKQSINTVLLQERKTENWT